MDKVRWLVAWNMFVRQLLTLITLTLTSAKSTANIKRQITDESYDFIIAGGISID